MTDAGRIEEIRLKSQNLHGSGYHYPQSGTPTEAAHDIRFLLDQLDKTSFALSQAISPPCERCQERDQADAEAYDGLMNAYEMSGLQ